MQTHHHHHDRIMMMMDGHSQERIPIASPILPEGAIYRQQGTIKGLNYDRSMSIPYQKKKQPPKKNPVESSSPEDDCSSSSENEILAAKPATARDFDHSNTSEISDDDSDSSGSSDEKSDSRYPSACGSNYNDDGVDSSREVAEPVAPAAAKKPLGSRKDLIEAAKSLDTKRVRDILNSSAYGDVNKANARTRELLALECRPSEEGGSSCHNQSALHAAIAALPYQETDEEKIQNWKDLLKLLLEFGANPNEYFDERNRQGSGGKRTAFQMVLDRGGWKDIELLRLFLDAGADPNLPAHRFVAGMRADGYATRFPLHTAVDKGAPIECIIALLEAGANVNARRIERVRHERGFDQDRDESPLHVAVEKGFVTIAACLLLSGADADAEQRYLHEAKPAPDLGRGCVRRTQLKRRPIHAAIKAKSPSLVKLLVLHGASKESTSLNGDIQSSIEKLIENEISDARTKMELLRALQAADGWSRQDVHGCYPKIAFQNAVVWERLLSANSGKWPLDQNILHRILSFAAEMRPNPQENSLGKQTPQE